jgi:hypothetical protein
MTWAKVVVRDLLLVVAVVFGAPFEAWASKGQSQRKGYIIESQDACKVVILAREGTPGKVGDIVHFQNVINEPLAKGRVLLRGDGPKSGIDRMELLLAESEERPCPPVKGTRVVFGDAKVRGDVELVSLPSHFETILLGGYLMESWNVSEKTSGSGIAAGLMISYELPRSGPVGFLLHGLTQYQMLTMKNSVEGLAGVDPKTDATRLLVGGGLGIGYHLGANGQTRLQVLALYERSVMGNIRFKIADKDSERDLAVTGHMRPGIRLDQVLFSGVQIGLGVSYARMALSIPDAAGSQVDVSGDATQADLSLGVQF